MGLEFGDIEKNNKVSSRTNEGYMLEKKTGNIKDNFVRKDGVFSNEKNL